MSISVTPVSVASFSIISTMESLTIGIFEAAWTNKQSVEKNRRAIENAFAGLREDLPALYHISVNGSDEAEDFVIDKLHSTNLPSIAILTRGGIIEHNFQLNSDGSFSSDLFGLIFNRVKNDALRALRNNRFIFNETARPATIYSESVNTGLSVPFNELSLTKIVSQILQQTDRTRNPSRTLHSMDVVNDDPQLHLITKSVGTTDNFSGENVENFQTFKLFLSGDKSSVGKSSTCMAILASLVRLGIQPSSIAYIKVCGIL